MMTMTMMINSLKIVKMFGRIGKISRTRKYCSNSKSQQPIKFLSSTACDSKEPPELPSTCCMSEVGGTYDQMEKMAGGISIHPPDKVHPLLAAQIVFGSILQKKQ